MSDEVSRSGLKEATLDGVRWVALGRGAAEVVAFASGVVLAHLVSPTEFGRLAVAVIAGELAMMFAAEGIGNALVQRKAVERAHVESAAFLGLVIGGILALLTYFAVRAAGGRPAVRRAHRGDIPGLLAHVPGGGRADRAAGDTAAAPGLQAHQRDRGGRSCSPGAAVSVVLAAVAGLNAEAYVLGSLAGAVLATALLFASAGIVLPRWHPREMRELLGFGAPAALAGMTWVGQRNVDYAILGARLGAGQVGPVLPRLHARCRERAAHRGDHRPGRVPGLLAHRGPRPHARRPGTHHASERDRRLPAARAPGGHGARC